MKKKLYKTAKFNMRQHEEGELVDAFITVSYKLASKCNYGTLDDELIKERIEVVHNYTNNDTPSMVSVLSSSVLEKVISQQQVVKIPTKESKSSARILTSEEN